MTLLQAVVMAIVCPLLTFLPIENRRPHR